MNILTPGLPLVWVVFPVLAFSGFALVLGPAGSVQVWTLGAVYYSVLVVPVIAAAILVGRRNWMRTAVVPLQGSVSPLVRNCILPGFTGMLFCTVMGIDLPAPRLWTFQTEAEHVGAALGASQFVMFFADYLGMLGFPPRGAEPAGAKSIFTGYNVFYFSAAFAFVMTHEWPWLFPVIAVVSLVNPVLATRNRMFALAQSTFSDADEAQPRSLEPIAVRPWAIQLTDVHLASPGPKTAEGDEDGTAMMRAWGLRVASLKPSFVFITGDLVDAGEASEWEKAHTLLAPFQDTGARILLVPGNHDLVAAYGNDAWVATAISAWSPAAAHRLNGSRLRRFLESAARMDAGILLYNGSRLVDELGRMRSTLDAVCALLDEVKGQWAQSDAARKLENATKPYFNNQETGIDWARVLRFGTVGEFRDRFQDEWFAREWHRMFPLQVADPDTRTLIVILNSVPDELLLLESAWGRFGDEQLSRFENLVQSSGDQRLVILVHHPTYKWADEPEPQLTFADIQRWAGLATAKPAADAFGAILARAVAASQEVVVLCGHRHGGSASEPRTGSWRGGTTVEGASLATGGRTVAALAQTSGSRLTVGICSLG